jgi:hypothetical protein
VVPRRKLIAEVRTHARAHACVRALLRDRADRQLRSAVMPGDSGCGCLAAKRAGVPIPSECSRAQELLDAGAVCVVRGLREVLDDLESTPFGGRMVTYRT